MGKDKRKRKSKLQKRQQKRTLSMGEELRSRVDSFLADMEDKRAAEIDSPKGRAMLADIGKSAGIPEALLRSILHGLMGNQTRAVWAAAEAVQKLGPSARRKRQKISGED